MRSFDTFRSSRSNLSHKMDELANELGMIDVVDERLASGFHPSSSTASSTSTIGCHPNEFRSQSMDHSAVGCQPRDEGEGEGEEEGEEPSSRIRCNPRSNKVESYPDGLPNDANDRTNDHGTGAQSRAREASSNRGVECSRREGEGETEGSRREEGTESRREGEGENESRRRVGIIDRSSGQSSGSIRVTQTQPLSSSPSKWKSTFSTSGQDRGGKGSVRMRGSASNTTGYDNNFPHESLAPLIGANVGVVSRKSMSAHDINLDVVPSCSGLMDTIMGSPSSSFLQGHHGDRTSFDRRSLPGIGVPKKSSRNGKPVARSASILLRSKVLILSDSESEEEHSQSSRGSESRSKSGQSSSRKGKGRKSRKKSVGVNSVKGFCPFGGETNYGNLSVPGYSGLQVHSAPVTSGKRKRSTTTSFSASGEHSDHHHHHGNKMETSDTIDTMDMDNVYDSSSLSESSTGTDCEGQGYDEADDEQSDFYEVMSRVGGEDGRSDMSGRPGGRKYHHHHHHHHRASKPMMVPRNPFATVTASPPPGPSSSVPASSSAGSTPSAAVYWKRRKRNQW